MTTTTTLETTAAATFRRALRGRRAPHLRGNFGDKYGRRRRRGCPGDEIKKGTQHRGDLLLKVTVLHIAKKALQFRYSTYQQVD